MSIDALAWQERHVCFAHNSVTVQHDAASGPLVDFLYSRIAKSSQSRIAESDQSYQLSCVEGMYTLLREGERLYRGRCQTICAERLLGDSCYQLADQSRGGLLFHAAAVSWQGHGLLLPGASGRGKTTLTAWLLSQGWTYHTDELVFIPSNGSNGLDFDHIQSFTRPLNLKSSSLHVVAQFWDMPAFAPQLIQNQDTLLAHPNLFRNTDKFSLHAVLFPYYHPTANLQFQQLSKAKAGLQLLECLINARNLTGHGVSPASRLARTVPCYTARYQQFHQLIQPLMEVIGQDKMSTTNGRGA